jgi:hypothetical protein
MKRSAFFVHNVPKARFIAEGDFIFHAPSGALHSAKNKKTGNACLFVLAVWGSLNPKRREGEAAERCRGQMQ